MFQSIIGLAQAWCDAKAYADAEREMWIHRRSGSLGINAKQLKAQAVLADWFVFAHTRESRHGKMAHVFRWMIRWSRKVNPVFLSKRRRDLEWRRDMIKLHHRAIFAMKR